MINIGQNQAWSCKCTNLYVLCSWLKFVQITRNYYKLCRILYRCMLESLHPPKIMYSHHHRASLQSSLIASPGLPTVQFLMASDMQKPLPSGLLTTLILILISQCTGCPPIHSISNQGCREASKAFPPSSF